LRRGGGSPSRASTAVLAALAAHCTKGLPEHDVATCGTACRTCAPRRSGSAYLNGSTSAHLSGPGSAYVSGSTRQSDSTAAAVLTAGKMTVRGMLTAASNATILSATQAAESPPFHRPCGLGERPRPQRGCHVFLRICCVHVTPHTQAREYHEVCRRGDRMNLWEWHERRRRHGWRH
jgi:hypothetical protein